MTKPMVRIHDISNDELIDREMTDEEYALFLADQELQLVEKAKIEKAEADKAALLEKLGITADEAKLLLS
jgi:hypothetical protein